ncbi:retrotransposon protein, putative, ty1-copia subclass [Tanacetum coccineum]
MLKSGFKINECDKCVYVKDTSSGYVILCLYVDDMIIIGSNDKMIKSTKDMLKLKFDMKDMGLADVILGIKIIRTHNRLVLSQAHYVDKILNTHNARDSGLTRTPIDTSLHLSKNRGVGVVQLEYSIIIYVLMYLMTCTQPDLAYAVSRLSRDYSNILPLDKKSKGKVGYLAPKAGIVKQKFQGTCYNCDQPGHGAANCKMPKWVTPRQANMVNDNMDMIVMVSDVTSMISKVNLDMRQDQPKEEEVELRRSKRARTKKSFVPDFVSFMVKNEPASYREAVTSLEGNQWKEAIKSEIDSILQNHTWDLMDLPLGFRQREGLDYFDTNSPVTRITSIRMVLAIAALRNLDGYQMDMKMVFLNDDLEEKIYMNQLEGFIAPGHESKVCRLVKSLYDLKQAPTQWHQKFDHTMLESGSKINECDKCVYVKDTSSGYVILCLYVDDMLIIGSNEKMIKSTKDMLKSKFDMKDMGFADVILGIEIIRTQN